MAATTNEILLKLKMVSDISDVTGNVKQIQQVLNKIDMPKDLKQKFTGVFADLERETKNYQNLLDSGFKGKKDVTGLEASGKRINTLMKTLETSMKGIRAEDLERSFRVDPASIQKLNNELEEARTNLSNIISSSGFQDITKEAEAAADAMQKVSKTKFTGNFLEAVKKGDIQGAADALKQLEANHKQFKDEAKNTQYNEAFREMSRILGELQKNTALQETNTKIQNLKTELGDINITELQKFLETFQNGQGAVGDMTNQVRGFTQANNDAAAAQQRTNSELDQLKSRIGYFFSLTNSVMLFRRAVTGALNTIKELDKTMTEAAVVTEFDVGDMWERLPQYSKEAQKLGVSINGMYQATTLYYQQGLKTNAAMQLGVETMKMAKIAGIESSEATKAMTAALRGFNMELNETSATKVNDVYSQLAAVTAADVSQISTAMEKTASIAASANMEFETTAALLAQIIETTQEAPETAGTAMKTIIARFSEVKSLRDQGLTTGQDEEGESVDVNKIQTALRSVGISMEGFFSGNEGLDTILLKLAEKWQSLDFETQRYIATMAAGSRQQSRFIAMMSDYSRTTELVGEAQNSVGASQRQFNKTLDSMESKLTRLKNAWDQYLMGLTNNEVLKFGIDILTNVLETINKITDAISGSNGLMKAVVSLVGVIGGLSLGKALLNPMLGAVGGLMGIGGATISTTRQGVDKNGQPVTITETQKASPQQKKRGFLTGLSEKDVAAREMGAVKGNKQWKSTKKFIAKGSQSPEMARDSVAASISGLTDGQLKEANKAFDETYQATGNVNKSMDAMAQKTQQLGGTIQNTNGETIQFAETQQKLKINTAAVGGALMGAGAAAGGLAAIFSTLGMEEEAETASKLAVVLFGVGAAIQFIGPLLEGLGNKLISMGAKVSTAWIAVTVIAAAIAALVAGWVVLSKHIKETSDVGKLEKLNEKVNELSSAAERTKEEFDGIAEAKQGLEDMGKTIESLTVGTKEWRQALLENNQQVLSMLDTYPELAQYITHGTSGQLVIKQEGWDQVENKKLESYGALITSKTIVANQASQQQQLVNTRLKMEEERGLGEAYQLQKIFGTEEDIEKRQTGGLTYEEYNKLASAAAELELSATSMTLSGDNLTKAFERAGLDANLKTKEFENTLLSMGTTFDELAIQAQMAKETEKARLQATIDSVAATSKLVTNSEEFAEVVKSAVVDNSEDYSQEIITEAEKNLQLLQSDKDKDEDKQMALYQQYAQLAGLGDAEQVKKKVETGEISKTEIAYALASEGKNDELVASLEGLTKTLEKIDRTNKKGASGLKGLFSSQGGLLTLKELKETGYLDKDGNISKFTSENVGARLKVNNEDLVSLYENLGLENLDAFVDYLNRQAKMGYGNYEQALESFETRGIQLDEKVVEGLSSAAAKGISDNLTKIYTQQGSTNEAERAINMVQDFLNQESLGLKESTKQELFNAFATSNWTSVEDLEQVAAIWADELGENSGAMQTLFNGVKELTNATTALTIAQQNEENFSIQDIIDKIASGNINVSAIDKSTKDEIVKVLGAGFEKNFIRTGLDSFTYRGSLVGDLQKAMHPQESQYGALSQQQKLYNTQTSYENALDDRMLRGKGHKMTYSQTAIDTMRADVNSGVSDDLIGLGMNENASQEDKDFKKQLDSYLQGFGSIDDLWTAYQKTSSTFFQSQEGFTEAVNKAKTATATQAGNLGLSGYALVDSDNTLGQQVTDILGNEAKYEGLANSGDEDAVNTITNTYNSVLSSVGETPQKNLDAKTMISEIKRVKETYGVGAFSEVSVHDGETYGSGVASDAGFASSFNYQLSDKEGKELFGQDSDKIAEFNEKAKESFYNTIDGLNQALGADAFSATIDAAIGKIDEEKESFVDATGAEIDYTKAKQMLQVTLAKEYNQVKKMVELLSDYEDILVSSKRGTTEYAQALNQVKTSLASIFDFDEKAIDELLNSGAITNDQIEKMVAGDESAFEEISIAIRRAALEGYAGVNFPPVMIDAIMTASGNINLTELEEQLAQLDSSLDATTQDGRKKLQELYEEAGKQIQFTVDQDGKTVSATVIDTDYKDLFSNARNAIKGSSGGSKYENKHDKQYNTYEKINSLLREREKLERRYDKLLEDRSATAKDLIKNSEQELVNLAEQEKRQEYLKNAKLQEIKDLMSKNSKYSSYVTGFDEKTGTISIDWDAFERLKDSDKGSKIDDYLSELEGLRDQWQDAQDAIEEIEDAVKEVKDRGKEEYKALEERIKEALVNNRQKEIDKLSEINESINDTNARLLESMQEQIDEYRQNRDNEKTEKELEDKQRRLAYLQQDTSGANATEILKLQKEIEEGQESYTDQLIDQKISELQKQNDEAAEQRQEQIDLLQAQLDHDIENGNFWPEVYDIMKQVTSGNSAFAVWLLQGAEGYKGMSNMQKEVFDEELTQQINKSTEYATPKQEPKPETSNEPEWNSSYPKPSTISGTLRRGSTGNNVRGLQEALKMLGYTEVGSVDGVFGKNTEAAVKRFQKDMSLSADGIVGSQTKAAFATKHFKTGGLASFTGPAWLDGTKSRPEYVLNADQTKAFFTLVDVLTGLTSKGAQSTQNNGDSNYDIDINVESIGSDYDVEQLASKIKSLINEDARYRNNNAISLMR